MLFRLLTKSFLLVGMASLSRQVCAQGTFRPGYLVQVSGDTTKGEVQVRGAMRSSLTCRFRPTATAASTDYGPAQLRGYGIYGVAAYRTQLVPALESEAAATLFVKVLVTGKATLYTRQDRSDQVRYYLAMGTDSLRELRRYRVPQVVDNRTVYEEKSPFRDVVAKAFRDCPAVQPLLPRLALTATDLARVVVRYNQCVGGPAPVVMPKERSRLGAGITGGLNASRINFSSQFAQLHDGSFTDTSPAIGIFATFSSPQLNRNLALRLDVLYTSGHYEDAYIARNVSTVETRNRASFTCSYLKIPLQLRYYFNTGKVRPFLLVGVSATRLLSYSSHLRSEYSLASGPPVVSEGDAVKEEATVRTHLGLLVGAGIATPGLAGHAIGLELRGESGSGFVIDNLAPMQQLGVMLSIDLTK